MSTQETNGAPTEGAQTPAEPIVAVAAVLLDQDIELPADEPAVVEPHATPVTQAAATDEPKAAPAATDEVSAAPVEVVMKKQNVQIQYPILEKTDSFDQSQETLVLPSDFERVIDAKTAALPDDYEPKSKQEVDWAVAISEGRRLSSFEETGLSTLELEDALYMQEIDTGAGVARGYHPGFNPEGEVLKGARAVQYMSAHLGLGGYFRFPLYNSGIWLTVKPPAEADILELNRQNIADKIMFGRQSYGLAGSNMSSVVADRLVNFVLSNLHSSSVEAGVDLKTIISSQDIPTMIWGIANATYPGGFQYRRACVCDPAKCNHIVEERLNLTKVHFTNQRALSSMQRAHIANNKAGSMTLKSIQNYQNERINAQKREIEVVGTNGKKIKMLLRVPTVAEYIESGYRWIGDITKIVNASLGVEANDTERNNYMISHGQTAAMRQYIHWVESVLYGEHRTDEVETNEKLFSILSQDDKLRDAFMEKVTQYVDDTQISVLGIPTYDCPKCGAEQKAEKEMPHVANVIPIDAYQTFFTLLVQRIERIQRR